MEKNQHRRQASAPTSTAERVPRPLTTRNGFRKRRAPAYRDAHRSRALRAVSGDGRGRARIDRRRHPPDVAETRWPHRPAAAAARAVSLCGSLALPSSSDQGCSIWRGRSGSSVVVALAVGGVACPPPGYRRGSSRGAQRQWALLPATCASAATVVFSGAWATLIGVLVGAEYAFGGAELPDGAPSGAHRPGTLLAAAAGAARGARTGGAHVRAARGGATASWASRHSPPRSPSASPRLPLCAGGARRRAWPSSARCSCAASASAGVRGGPRLRAHVVHAVARPRARRRAEGEDGGPREAALGATAHPLGISPSSTPPPSASTTRHAGRPSSAGSAARHGHGS